MSLNELYKKFNYPSKNKLYLIAKKEGIKTTQKEIDEFLKKQSVSQIYKRKGAKAGGHIVAFHPDERYQMDLIDLTNFRTQNIGNGWILLLVDIFTRQVYGYPMKDKTEKNIQIVLKQFLDKHEPNILISDNESGFKSKQTQKLIDEHDVEHDMVEPQDHKALGVIDRAVQTIKNAIFKYMRDENTAKYINQLESIIEAYNETRCNDKRKH